MRWLEYYWHQTFGRLSERVGGSGGFQRVGRAAFRVARQYGFRELAVRLKRRASTRAAYVRWIAAHDYQPERDRPPLKRAIGGLKKNPLISVVMPVFNTPGELLEAAIGSVIGQVYPHWELCIADDHSTIPEVRAILERHAASDSRIKVVFRAENGRVSAASNSALALVTGDWVVLLDHDDLLREQALAEVALELAQHPDAEIIYSDEDKIGRRGGNDRYAPYFKPNFSRELFRSYNYLNHLTAHRADNIRKVGGWRVGFEGSQDYDLNLRIFESIDPARIRHISKILYHWRATEGSTAATPSAKPFAYEAGLRALREHVARTALAASVETMPHLPTYRLRPSLPAPAPLVSLIIPTRDGGSRLQRCIDSIRFRTDYPGYEILIIDNGSVDVGTRAYLGELAQGKLATVIPFNRPFNYPAINNAAVARAKGAVVGLLNDDVEVISPGWLTEMTAWATLPGTGCVGAKLYYGNETIQHAGIIIGIGGVAGHSHKYFPRNDAGYFTRLKIVQNVSAVTGACLVVRKQVYEEVGGMDETALEVAFNDVDLCLKVMAAGYHNVWTPFAELYHVEGASRGRDLLPAKQARFAREVAYMQRKWSTRTIVDPYYSPHLTREREDFSIRAD